jgi:hypothetical protein
MERQDNRPSESLQANQLQEQSPADAAARLRQAIAFASAGGDCRNDVQAAARELVTELRLRQEPPERALLHIKEILAEAGLRPSYAPPESDAAGIRATMYQDVIAWSIRYYYDGR